jgi:hypothetical protein
MYDLRSKNVSEKDQDERLEGAATPNLMSIDNPPIFKQAPPKKQI